jgi:hypothetical protein
MDTEEFVNSVYEEMILYYRNQDQSFSKEKRHKHIKLSRRGSSSRKKIESSESASSEKHIPRRRSVKLLQRMAIFEST